LAHAHQNALGLSLREVARFFLLSACLITVGVGLQGSPVVQTWAADPLIVAIAEVATVLIEGAGGAITRVGNVLTHTGTDISVHVTEACDGLGIFMVFAAALAALRFGWRATLAAVAGLFVLVQLFNLARVVGLFYLRAGPQAFYDAAHLYLVPYLTALICGAYLIAACDRWHPNWARAGSTDFHSIGGINRTVFARFIVALALGFAVWWITGPYLLFPALRVVAAAIAAIVHGPAMAAVVDAEWDQWIVQTRLLKPGTVNQLFDIPVQPRHFTLGFPLIWAAVFCVSSSRRELRNLAFASVIAFAAYSLVLALQLMVTVPKVAERTAANVLILEPSLVGPVVWEYRPPPSALIALLDLLRVSLVYLNFFLLPTALAALAWVVGRDRPEAQVPRERPRRSRARRR
jgi:exosortase/archaeosortase family protein